MYIKKVSIFSLLFCSALVAVEVVQSATPQQCRKFCNPPAPAKVDWCLRECKTAVHQRQSQAKQSEVAIDKIVNSGMSNQEKHDALGPHVEKLEKLNSESLAAGQKPENVIVDDVLGVSLGLSN